MNATNQLEQLIREAGDGPVSGPWLAERLRAIRDELADERQQRTPAQMAKLLADSDTDPASLLAIVVTTIRHHGRGGSMQGPLIETQTGYAARAALDRQRLKLMLVQGLAPWLRAMDDGCNDGSCAVCRGGQPCH